MAESKKQYFDVAPPAKKPQTSSAKVMNHAKVPLLEDLTDDQTPSNAMQTSGSPFRPGSLVEPKEKGNEEHESEAVSHDGFTITPLPEKDTTPETEDQPGDEAASEVSDAIPVINESDHTEEKVESDLGAQAVESAQEPANEPEAEPEPEPAPDTKAEPDADTGPEDSATGSGGQDAQESVDKDVPVSQEQFALANISEDSSKKAADAAKTEVQEPKIYDTKEYYVPIGKTHHKHGGAKGAFIFGIICAVVIVAAALYVMYRLSL